MSERKVMHDGFGLAFRYHQIQCGERSRLNAKSHITAQACLTVDDTHRLAYVYGCRSE